MQAFFKVLCNVTVRALTAEKKSYRGETIGNPLGVERIGKLMLQFAIPAIVSNLVNAAYNLIDQVLIGFSVGMLGIAATNIAFPLTSITAATAFLLGSGGASNYSLKLGEGDKDAANKFAVNTISLLAIAGIAIGAFVLIFVKPLVYAFGATETIEPLALTYTTIIAIGMPFGIFTVGASSLIRADGSPRYAMICTVVGAVFNVVIDPIIAFVLKWGLAGLAWSTTIGQMMTAAIALYYFLKKSERISLRNINLLPKLYLTGKTCALGVTACINQLGISVLQITLNNTLRYYGSSSAYGSDIPLGSVGAISKLNVVLMAFTIGIAQGCQPIQGFNYGAKKYDRVKKTLRLALISASLVSTAVFLTFQLFPRQLMFIFGESDPLYLEFAARYLRIFMFMTFLSGIQPIAATFFPAIGKARHGLLISLSRQIVFILPLLLILPVFFGLDGALYAGPASDFAAACVSAFLIVNEMKKITALQRAQISQET